MLLISSYIMMIKLRKKLIRFKNNSFEKHLMVHGILTSTVSKYKYFRLGPYFRVIHYILDLSVGSLWEKFILHLFNIV